MILFQVLDKIGKLKSRLRFYGYRLLGMRIGQRGYLGGKLYLRDPRAVALGDNVVVLGEVWFSFYGSYSGQPHITIGNETFIGQNCEFNISESISIGSDCLVASGCRFIDHDHGTSAATLLREQPELKAGIIIHQDVWLGSNCVVLKGVSIGRGSIVAAGAVVTKSIPEYEIWGGVPAKKIKARV